MNVQMPEIRSGIAKESEVNRGGCDSASPVPRYPEGSDALMQIPHTKLFQGCRFYLQESRFSTPPSTSGLVDA